MSANGIGELAGPAVFRAGDRASPVARPGDVARGAAFELVHLGAVRRHHEGGGIAAGVLAVDIDADQIVVADVAVALGFAGADQLGVAVEAVEGDVKVARIGAEPGLGLLGNGRVGLQAVEALDMRGGGPAGVV